MRYSGFCFFIITFLLSCKDDCTRKELHFSTIELENLVKMTNKTNNWFGRALYCGDSLKRIQFFTKDSVLFRKDTVLYQGQNLFLVNTVDTFILKHKVELIKISVSLKSGFQIHTLIKQNNNLYPIYIDYQINPKMLKRKYFKTRDNCISFDNVSDYLIHTETSQAEKYFYPDFFVTLLAYYRHDTLCFMVREHYHWGGINVPDTTYIYQNLGNLYLDLDRVYYGDSFLISNIKCLSEINN